MIKTLPIKIAIVEDHPPIIQSLSDYLNTVPEFKLVGTAKNIEGARVVIGSNDVDLVIMDLCLPDEKGNKFHDGGIALAAEFGEIYEDLTILVYTAEDHVEVVRRALDAGVRGYLLKTADIPIIKEAIEIAMAGGIYLDRDLPEVPKQRIGEALTPKEEQVLRLFAKWMIREEIGRELKIALATVNCHCNHIMEKLDLKNNTELIREAIRRYGNPDVDGVRKLDKERSPEKTVKGAIKLITTKNAATATKKGSAKITTPALDPHFRSTAFATDDRD